MMMKDFIPLKENIHINLNFSMVGKIVAAASVILIGFYLFGVVNFLEHGHHAYNTTREHPWGFLVSAYEFFVALSMGTIAIATSAIFFDIKALKPLVKRMLVFGLLALIAGFAVFLFEIGHPITMVIYTALSGHPTSALFWLGVFYPLTMLFTAITYVLYVKGKESKVYSMLALIFANSSILTAGSIFGLLNDNAFASGVFYQIEFIASGILGGIFLFSIIAKFFITTKEFEKGVLLLKGASIALISLLLIMYLVKFLQAVYGDVPGKVEIVEHIFASPRFWLFEILLGLVFPLFVAIWGSKEKIGMFCLASVFGLIGLMSARINVVEAVQIVPKQLMKVTEYQLPPSIISYTPSMTEWAIGLGAIGIFIFLLFIAESVLKLDKKDAH
ncbi:NrfD/PsrC family molybdoenzyme membrane anchor subunit [Sulfurovum sp.]|uniref:NrfD/PsrC family molybdoenzyme membrane anchor subunit n=1 Tax=Sulfurovum sp. TaxID=1969726 RepID=UPI0025D776B4|nr:NrfD/PsrC family molybdoenzyme membrane anchor subunit [Sulfurovum sp.]